MKTGAQKAHTRAGCDAGFAAAKTAVLNNGFCSLTDWPRLAHPCLITSGYASPSSDHERAPHQLRGATEYLGNNGAVLHSKKSK